MLYCILCDYAWNGSWARQNGVHLTRIQVRPQFVRSTWHTLVSCTQCIRRITGRDPVVR